MKLSTDTDVNVGYLQLPDEIEAGGVYRTVAVDLIEGSQINIDVDKRGAILGFEFLDVKTQLAALKEDFEKPL